MYTCISTTSSSWFALSLYLCPFFREAWRTGAENLIRGESCGKLLRRWASERGTCGISTDRMDDEVVGGNVMPRGINSFVVTLMLQKVLEDA